VSAYWVHHPTEGDYLIDAGLARAFGRQGGNYTALLRLILVLIGAGSRSTDGADVASRFGSRGISRRAVFLTHLHRDQTSGLVDLPVYRELLRAVRTDHDGADVRGRCVHRRKASTNSSMDIPASRISARRRPVFSSAWSGTVSAWRALVGCRSRKWLPRCRTIW